MREFGRRNFYSYVAQYDVPWWLFCKAHEIACLLRGPHRFQPVSGMWHLQACERCPVWNGFDGNFWGWYR